MNKIRKTLSLSSHAAGNLISYQETNQINYYLCNFLKWANDDECLRFPIPLLYGDTIFFETDDIIISDLKDNTEFSNIKVGIKTTIKALKNEFKYNYNEIKINVSSGHSLSNDKKEELKNVIEKQNVIFDSYDHISLDISLEWNNELEILRNKMGIEKRDSEKLINFLEKYVYSILFYTFSIYHGVIIKTKKIDDFHNFKNETKLLSERYITLFRKEFFIQEIKKMYFLYDERKRYMKKLENYIDSQMNNDDFSCIKKYSEGIKNFIKKYWDVNDCDLDIDYKSKKDSIVYRRKNKINDVEMKYLEDFFKKIYKYKIEEIKND